MHNINIYIGTYGRRGFNIRVGLKVPDCPAQPEEPPVQGVPQADLRLQVNYSRFPIPSRLILSKKEESLEILLLDRLQKQNTAFYTLK